MLRHVAGFTYKFQRGPWRKCYVRFGYASGANQRARYLPSLDSLLSRQFVSFMFIVPC